MLFRIRRVHDQVLPVDRAAVAQVQAILKAQFPEVRQKDVDLLPENIVNPFEHGFRTLVLVAERRPGKVAGFALVLHEPDLGFCWLDFISAAMGRTGGGIGGALYRAVREEALALDAKVVLMECAPDDPALCPDLDPQVMAQNRARLRFYEQFGARPVVGTAYETPVDPGDTCAPFLVCDPLLPGRSFPRDLARRAVRAILERKYAWLCPPAYVARVVASFGDDPVRLRPPRYVRKPVPAPAPMPAREPVLLVASDCHEIHHIRERGYVESPARVRSILRELRGSGLFEERRPQHFGDQWLLRVHAADYVSYFKRVCARLEPNQPVYPYVFPVRNATRPPRDLSVRAGYYCVDTFTPLTHNAFVAARRAVDCALTCARAVASGTRVAYALVRPPGHHAERRYFGGFCYFNNAAVVAEYLAAHGKVAILDLDYHHGNGQQEIFYERADVLTVSIHGDPSFAYPYFSGFAEERGHGAGQGFNLNLPLPETVDGPAYREALDKALRRIRRFAPAFLVVALGLDTAKADPTGTWSLRSEDFAANGARVGGLHLPTVVVQEGGYGVRVLGRNALAFFEGLGRAMGPH